MRINNIAATQPQFNGGKLNLYSVRQNGRDVVYKTIEAEGITIEEVKNPLRYTAQTLIKTADKDVYELNIPYETVKATYDKVVNSCCTESLIPPSEYTTPGFFG